MSTELERLDEGDKIRAGWEEGKSGREGRKKRGKAQTMVAMRATQGCGVEFAGLACPFSSPCFFAASFPVEG